MDVLLQNCKWNWMGFRKKCSRLKRLFDDLIIVCVIAPLGFLRASIAKHCLYNSVLLLRCLHENHIFLA